MGAARSSAAPSSAPSGRRTLIDLEKERDTSTARSEAVQALRDIEAHPPPATPPVTVAASPRFAVGDPAALEFLSANGYVVVANVLNEGEISTAHDHLWDWLPEATGWERGEMKSWNEQALSFVGLPAWGIVKAGGAGQSEFVWYVRTRAAVRSAFEFLWGSEQLLASFDGFSLFLPWHHGFKKTQGGWMHCDQGHTSQGLHTIQGFVSLTSQNANTGGLTVIPGSHHLHNQWVTKDTRGADIDFVPLGDSPVRFLPQKLVTCEPGDLVLWDSRCVHCNSPAMEQPTSPAGEFLRVAVYVCMVPKDRASPDNLRARKQAYDSGMSCNHSPLVETKDLDLFENSRGFEVRSLSETTDNREELIH